MAVSKHDIEWLNNTLDAYGDILPDDLVQSARELIKESRYRKSVCVIHPVDESRYQQIQKAIREKIL